MSEYIDPEKEFFCIEPWMGMYSHVNDTYPCHVNSGKRGLTPAQYLKSDFLQSLKDDNFWSYQLRRKDQPATMSIVLHSRRGPIEGEF